MMNDDGYPVECPQCGCMALSYDCWNGCEEGAFNEFEEDPINGDPDEWETCEVCHGQGGWTVCKTCGYDSLKKYE